MTIQERYEACFSILADHTPLAQDCGILCAKACCAGSREDSSSGMYLYPEEHTLYARGGDWFLLHETNFLFAGERVPLLSCSGVCPREKRPLACRLFPLIPHIRKDGNAGIRLHPFAGTICPLVNRGGVAGLAPDFVAAAQETARVLCGDDRIRAFVLAQQRMLRDGLLL